MNGFAGGFPVRGTDAVPWIESAVLASAPGARHAFSTRKGGESGGPWESLNLGYATGDDRETVERNRLRLWDTVGLPEPPFVPRQVHGNAVLVLEPGNLERCMADPPEADAVVTAMRRVPIAVLTADCASIIVYDRGTPAIAVVHAGWRGSVRAILWKAMLTLFEVFGTKSEDCLAAVGPAIAPGCYPVGDDVHEAFSRGLPYGRDLLSAAGPGSWLLDLREANRRQLLDARLPQTQVSVCPYCTHCMGEWFYSARRDHGTTGRHAAVAMLE